MVCKKFFYLVFVVQSQLYAMEQQHEFEKIRYKASDIAQAFEHFNHLMLQGIGSGTAQETNACLAFMELENMQKEFLVKALNENSPLAQWIASRVDLGREELVKLTPQSRKRYIEQVIKSSRLHNRMEFLQQQIIEIGDKELLAEYTLEVMKEKLLVEMRISKNKSSLH